MMDAKIMRWWGALAIVGLVGIAYLPVMERGGFIWDDAQHVTDNGTLRDLAGLGRIWSQPESIPQYYPVVHTTFWIEYHLWGARPLGYHIDNILLHCLGAILLWRLLIRLNVPAAWLAAAIFAVHPVQVESVAWITERKNVLSGVLYLASLGAYLRFSGEHFRRTGRDWRMYFLSLAIFVLALLSKSVVCSLPAVILLVIYWKNGRITRADVRPTIPFFVIGLGMAWLTAHLEETHVGAVGKAWDFSAIQRCLIAGRAVWFYVGKLVWPTPLAFVYPKWIEMNLSDRPWLVVFPVAVISAISALWMVRGKMGRGPLVGSLFFVGTLVPALGFVNVFPMRYTFVADHYQYLACIGLIVPISVILQRWMRSGATVVLIPLVFLSFRQGAIYHDSLSLWLDTRDKNPNSWMVWGNLGDEYAARGDRTDARECYHQLLQLAPHEAIAHWKWGIVLEYDSDWEGARAEFEKSIDLDGNSALSRASMAKALMELHRDSEATDYFASAVALDPGNAQIHYDYALALRAAGKIDEAKEQCKMSLAIKPDDADAGQLLLDLEARGGL